MSVLSFDAEEMVWSALCEACALSVTDAVDDTRFKPAEDYWRTCLRIALCTIRGTDGEEHFLSLIFPCC